MINLKSLSRKLEKLENSMQKEARRLSKLIRKIKRAAATQASPDGAKKIEKSAKTKTASSPAGKQKRKLSPEGRARLSALMHERWAAKRAATTPASTDLKAASPSPNDEHALVAL